MRALYIPVNEVKVGDRIVSIGSKDGMNHATVAYAEPEDYHRTRLTFKGPMESILILDNDFYVSVGRG
jgi:phosphatidylserine decarboxylase